MWFYVMHIEKEKKNLSVVVIKRNLFLGFYISPFDFILSVSSCTIIKCNKISEKYFMKFYNRLLRFSIILFCKYEKTQIY